MESKTSSAAAATFALPILGLLGIAFIVLKLCGTINWSWWWVLAPFWIPVAIYAVCAILLAVWISCLFKAIGKWGRLR